MKIKKLYIVLLLMLMLFLSINNVIASDSEETIVDQLELNLTMRRDDINTSIIAPTFQIKNNDNKAVNLSDITIRYYFTADGFAEQNFWCDHATIKDAGKYETITDNVKGTFTMNKVSDTADFYLEIGFYSTKALGSGESLEIQGRISKIDWAIYNQANDFSFNNSKKVAVFNDGQLVWGTTPEAEKNKEQ